MNALDLAYLLLAGLAAPWWARKARGGWAERLGRVPAAAARRDTGRPRLMLHAVSVGEVNAVRALVPLLTPECEVVVSATTDTGIERARALFGDSCPVARYPLDFSWSVDRFLDAVRPDAVALVELEVWPNFVRACSRRRVPVCVINGRLSERSFRGYRRGRALISPSFRRLEFAAVQDRVYAERFEAMGVPSNRCLVTGSMKWDAAPGPPEGVSTRAAALARELGLDPARPLIVAGSTAEGEEALLHAACPQGAQLLCAPRKPERFDEAAAALPGCVRRSRPAGGAAAGGDRFLLDTIGELREAYALADVVVVGRSFGALFGSDPIEPVALGKATVVGPAVANFRSIVDEFLGAGAIVQTSREGLAGVLSGLVADPRRRAELARRGLACVEEQRGASARHAELLLSLLPTQVHRAAPDPVRPALGRPPAPLGEPAYRGPSADAHHNAGPE